MEMQFKNEIKKLADVVVWADNWITELKDGLTGEQLSGTLTGKYVKEFETVKKVVLESMERHAVYTSALNNDIAEKAAKIELLEKEIEGRKAGYYNLKDRLDTAREIEDHWKREYETLTTNFSAKSVELNEANNKINDLKEEIEKLNKCIMNKNESINTGNEAIVNLRKEIGAREDEAKKLENRIKELKESFNALKEETATRYITIETHNSICETYENRIAELENDMRYKIIIEYQDTIASLNKDIDSWKHDVYEELKKNEELEEKIKKLTKELEEMTKSRDTWFETAGAHGETIRRDSEEIKKLNKEVEKRFKYIISQSETICNLKKELAKKDDEIKKLKEDNLQLSVGRVDTDFVNKLIQENDYYKDQERIRTDQLRATESKVEELYKQIENLKKESKNKNDIIRKAYTRYIDEACKDREEIMDECYKNLTKDDTGYIGFKQYTLRALEKKEGNEKEAKEFLCNEVSLIFYNKKAEEKRKEEETEVKGNGRTSSGRYPWGAKVRCRKPDGIYCSYNDECCRKPENFNCDFKDDIPCGEDAIE